MTTENPTSDKRLISGLTPEFMMEMNAFMSEKAVMEATTLSRTSIYRKRMAGKFPEPEFISEGRVGYRVRDVYRWLQAPNSWPNP